MSVLTQRVLWYIQSSLQVYRELHEKALATVAELQQKGVSRVYLQGNDEKPWMSCGSLVLRLVF